MENLTKQMGTKWLKIKVVKDQKKQFFAYNFWSLHGPKNRKECDPRLPRIQQKI